MGEAKDSLVAFGRTIFTAGHFSSSEKKKKKSLCMQSDVLIALRSTQKTDHNSTA
jgi:hypothetical protein